MQLLILVAVAVVAQMLTLDIMVLVATVVVE
jgi:hypothetical protein